MRVAVVSHQGGAGRTTVAILLAAWLAGRDHTALADLDLPPTIEMWSARRGVFPFTVTALGTNPAGQLARLAQEPGHLVIDTPSHHQSRSRKALAVADVALVPTRPEPIDLWSLRQTGATVRAIRRRRPLRAWVLLTMVRDAGTATAARKAIEQDDLVGLPVLEPSLAWRADYAALGQEACDLGRLPDLAEIGAVGEVLLNDLQP